MKRIWRNYSLSITLAGLLWLAHRLADRG
jgi:hypothetical protein